MKYSRCLLPLLLTLAIPFASCGSKKNESVDLSSLNLNSLTEKEYNAFNRAFYDEAKKDAQTAGEQAKTAIIGMAGLEARPESHVVFEVDVNFNINSMLLLVANANKIKRESEFVEEFKRQMASVRPQLKTEDERTYFDVFTALLLSEHSKL
ncbi:MAG: hypothetical protein RLZZ505_1455 [Verrucomicrobiota bacterium]